MSNPEIDQIVEYTKKFIEAATPIAKQAYEIGLVTLRIDAAQSLLLAVAFLLAAFFAIKKIKNDFIAAKAKAQLPEHKNNIWRQDTDYHLPLGGVLHGLVAFFSAGIGLWAAVSLLDIWLWVKLFSPQFWLAHIAVQKIIG